VRWHPLSNGEVPAKLRLEWHEHGGPPVSVSARPGYGTSVIRDLIPYELGGSVELDFATDGVRCAIEISVEASEIVK
jgi:two-component sensor histidine kinase